MQKLVLFIERETISVFQQEEKQLKNIRIKGEAFYNYKDANELFVFIFDYLLNILEIEDYSDYEIILYHSESTKDAFETCKNDNSFGKILHLEINVLKSYQEMLKFEFDNSEKNYKIKYNELLENWKTEREGLLNKISSQDQKREEVITSIISKVKNMSEKAQKWDTFIEQVEKEKKINEKELRKEREKKASKVEKEVVAESGWVGL